MSFPTSNAFQVGKQRPVCACEPTHISAVLELTKRELAELRKANEQANNESKTECQSEPTKTSNQ